MTVLNNLSSGAAGRLAVTTVLFAGIGFVSGFLLSLVAAVSSFYSCSAIL